MILSILVFFGGYYACLARVPVTTVQKSLPVPSPGIQSPNRSPIIPVPVINHWNSWNQPTPYSVATNTFIPENVLFCPMCTSSTSWDHCNPTVLPCGSSWDNKYHSLIAGVNPSVPKDTPDRHWFQCMKIAFQTATVSNGTLQFFVAGCGYGGVDYCRGWDDGFSQVMTCESCQFGCGASGGSRSSESFYFVVTCFVLLLKLMF
ncbi:uncharacterized protein LOC120426231 [Culex pipiens pallens]|uniref:uncharacterized protein LOC120426231 n=1 Tax=Culex pipiens pallens TaxID=42434 RepID=UPI001953A885|nr:uncharacterized protein LOC120426231 [Culex pipiens pallens]